MRARQAHDLAFAHVEAHAFGDETVGVEQGGGPSSPPRAAPRADLWGVLQVAVGQRAADHVADEVVLVERVVSVRMMADGLAVADDLHLVGGLGDLVERGDDRRAWAPGCGASAVDHLEPTLEDLVVERGLGTVDGQRRCRAVLAGLRSCCSPPRLEIFCVEVDVEEADLVEAPSPASMRSVCVSMARPFLRSSPRNGCRAHREGQGCRASSWWMMTMPFCSESRTERNLHTSPL